MVLAHNIHISKRTSDVQIFQDVTFDTMLLSNNTLLGLKESGFFKPSPIQLHGVPLGKCGFDLILEAKSGTGKTAVFTIIALEELDLNKGLQVIILAPTREIAAQICEVFKQIGCKYDGLCVEVVMGGLPVQDDINKFKENKVNVLVGSPGRLKHLIHDKHIDINSVRLLVLDEADKLMENSFLPDIKYIYSTLPSQKQVILSSATYPENSKDLINQFVFGAQHICPNSNCVLLGVAQKVTYVKSNNNIVKQTENRFRELLKILSKKQFKQCLVFCNYQARVGELHKMLIKEKWPAEQLYGKQEQTDRLDAIKTLQEYKCRLLISTDLAARGIDASNVDLVINFEPPFEWQTYLHRIGRAGRYGSYGMAVTILCEGLEAKKFLNLLESLQISINLTPIWNESTVNNNIESEKTKEHKSLLVSKISSNSFFELWNYLCQHEEIQEIEGKLETFEDLSKSFKEVEINDIKSFSDLILSFNSNSEPDLNKNYTCHNHMSYKCIKTPTISDKGYFCIINNMKENLLNESLQEKSKPDFENHNYKNSTIEKLLLPEKSAYSNIRNDINKSIYGKPERNYHEQNNEELNIEVKNSVLDLGLPVAFNSSKNKPKTNKNNSCKKNVSRLSKEKENYNPNKYLEDRKENIVLSKDTEFIKMNAKPKYNNKSKGVSNPKYPRYKSSSSGCSSIVYDESNKIIDATNYYKNWYNKLKSKVKQIELAIYIDELSKI